MTDRLLNVGGRGLWMFGWFKKKSGSDNDDRNPIRGKPTTPVEVTPTEFVTQVLEPTGGTILRPKEWFYVEGHRGPTFMWTLSREERSDGGPYTTGVRVQAFTGVLGGTGKTAERFILDFAAIRRDQAERVISTREQQDQGLFTRIGLETVEGPNHILYSLFWGNNGLDIAVVSIAGTTKELWQTYAPVFDRMASFELIDMTRFAGK
jgi:hypothetical protein